VLPAFPESPGAELLSIDETDVLAASAMSSMVNRGMRDERERDNGKGSGRCGQESVECRVCHRPVIVTTRWSAASAAAAARNVSSIFLDRRRTDETEGAFLAICYQYQVPILNIVHVKLVFVFS
jgi:hypothetical protein